MLDHGRFSNIKGIVVITLIFMLMFIVVMTTKSSYDSNDLVISDVSVNLSENILDEDKVTISSIAFEREENDFVSFMRTEPKLNFKTKKDYQDIGLDVLLNNDSYTFYKKDAEKIIEAIESNYIGELYVDIYSK